MHPICAVLLLLFSLASSSYGFYGYAINSRKTRDHRTFEPVHMSTISDDVTREATKEELLEVIASTPRNAPTSKTTTEEILSLVKKLEETCPTSEDDVLESLSGGWELLWTAQVQYDAS